MAGLVQLRGSTKPGWTGADDGNFSFSRCAKQAASALTQPVLPAVVDDLALDVLDGDGRRADAQDARAFARRGTNATGEFREIIGLMQAFEGFAPKAAIDEVVPFGNEIVDGAAGSHAADERAGVAEGNAAIHATGTLLLEFLGVQMQMELVPVLDAFKGRPVKREFPQIFYKAFRITHFGQF